MADSFTGNATLSTLEADLAALKRDVASLVENLSQRVTNQTEATAAQVEAGARRAYRSAAEMGEQSTKALSRQVEEQPLMALLLVLGLGFIGGRLLGR